MNDEARRIDEAWYLLSLDLTRPYLGDMWFPFKATTALDGMRQRIGSDDLPTYGSDPEMRVYRNLIWLNNEIGIVQANAFLDWQRTVLQIRPRDRIAEAWWNIAIVQIAQHSDSVRLSSETTEMLMLVRQDVSRLEAQVRTRLDLSSGQLSPFDHSALQLQTPKSLEDALQAVLATIANTIGANNFVRVWQQRAGNLDMDQLLKLRAVAERVCKEFGGPPYLGSPFPGIWQPLLAAWMENTSR